MNDDRTIAGGPPGETILELRVFARPDQLKKIRTAVRDAAAAAGCSENCTEEVVIAMNEACMNVMEHGYELDPNGELTVQLSVDNGILVAWLGDQCAPVDQADLKSRPLEDLRPGGLGVHFMRECMDDVAFLTPPAGLGNLLQMTKRIS
jgi:sigma-B regulation protein RsbU (phosphoserine phosphatase)